MQVDAGTAGSGVLTKDVSELRSGTSGAMVYEKPPIDVL